MSSKILVIDDDLAIVEMPAMVMERGGFDTVVVDGDLEAVKTAERENPDLIPLDLTLPGMSGVDVCRIVREMPAVPIIMLTVKIDMVDVILDLEPGAGGYAMKPFKLEELVAWVRIRLRRQENNPSETLEIGDLITDVPGHAVLRDGRGISLTPLGFDLLHVLVFRPKQVFSRDELLEKVWGYQHTLDTRLINVHVQRSCSKVKLDLENLQIVLTIRGVGYKTGD